MLKNIFLPRYSLKLIKFECNILRIYYYNFETLQDAFFVVCLWIYNVFWFSILLYRDFIKVCLFSYLIIRKHVSRLIKEGLDNIWFLKNPYVCKIGRWINRWLDDYV